MVRAAAANPDKARLVGISVARTSTLVWGISAAFTATTIIVLAAVQFVTPLGAANGTAQLTLGYPVLVKALLIAMIARMRILWLTVPVGMALGIIEVIFQQNVQGIDANVFALWLFVATLVVVLTLAPTARACGRLRAVVEARRAGPSRCPNGSAASGWCANCRASASSRFSSSSRIIPAFAHPGVAVVPLDARRDLRDRRVLAHDPERVGRTALARPVRLLGDRRPRHRAHGRRRVVRRPQRAVGRRRRVGRARRRGGRARRSGSPRSASPACTSR